MQLMHVAFAMPHLQRSLATIKLLIKMKVRVNKSLPLTVERLYGCAQISEKLLFLVHKIVLSRFILYVDSSFSVTNLHIFSKCNFS